LGEPLNVESLQAGELKIDDAASAKADATAEAVMGQVGHPAGVGQPLTKHTKICPHAGQCTVCNAGFNAAQNLVPFLFSVRCGALSPQRMRHEHRSR